MMSNLMNYQGQDFETITATQQLVVVDFFATWCPPCQRLLPVLDEVCLLEKDILFYKVDVDFFRQLALEKGVSGFPTLILYKEKKELARHSGFLNKEDLLKFLHSYK
ncbi:thioredoxin family protein [Paulownia witches'-broom phytoplasma]|uniref:Thioredoxin n=2 Tax=Paulownia witches'-broom phytoplasma TaxID=39647 RepID=A0ABX8TQ11_9MOLU|nr:thioredoxin family protein [Paulownia witches'-broom phytoplasma]